MTTITNNKTMTVKSVKLDESRMKHNKVLNKKLGL